jgi:hypothetical protein
MKEAARQLCRDGPSHGGDVPENVQCLAHQVRSSKPLFSATQILPSTSKMIKISTTRPSPPPPYMPVP